MRSKGLFIFVLTLCTSSTAYAWLCTNAPAPSRNTGALWWGARSVAYAVNEASIPTNQLSAEQVLQIFDESFNVWENLTGEAGCTDIKTDLTFTQKPQQGTTSTGYNAVYPNKNDNLLRFISDGWSDLDEPGVNNHQSAVIALTTTTWVECTAQLLSADIEFNAKNFTFGNATPGNHAITDLKNTAVHEIGHLIGLAHSGNSDATMYASASPGDTQKRDLACDDIFAVTFRYPKDKDMGVCPGIINYIDPPKCPQNSVVCGCCQDPQIYVDSAGCDIYLQKYAFNPIDPNGQTGPTGVSISTKSTGTGCAQWKSDQTTLFGFVLLGWMFRKRSRLFRNRVQINF